MQKSLENSLMSKSRQIEEAQVMKKKRTRRESFIKTGTGLYKEGEQLGNCIATEKGLLKKEDYDHIQKVIEIYSKALLC